MAAVFVSRVADQDAADILSFLTREAGQIVAGRYFRRFEDLFDRLAHHPESCRARPQLGRDIRICVIAPFLVIDRHNRNKDLVSVVRILHGHRRLTRDDLRARRS